MDDSTNPQPQGPAVPGGVPDPGAGPAVPPAPAPAPDGGDAVPPAPAPAPESGDVSAPAEPSTSMPPSEGNGTAGDATAGSAM